MGSRDVELDLIGHDHTGHATRSAANNLDQLKRKLGKFNVETNANLKRGMLRTGIQAGSAFATGFLKIISGGFLGRGTLGMAAKMSPAATAAGITVGALLASKVLSTAHAAILAGLPLALGAAIAAVPIVHLVKSQLEQAKTHETAIKKLSEKLATAKRQLEAPGLTKDRRAKLELDVKDFEAGIKNAQRNLNKLDITKLKTKWKGFISYVSKPMKVPLADAMKEVGSGLDRLRKPFAALVKAIGPAIAPFTKGVFDGIIGFVKALKPAMPGITAGLQEWGRQLPIIMTAFGDAFAAILKDPAKVQAAVRQIGDAIVWVADSLPGFVDGVKTLSLALKGLIGPIGLILPGLTAMVRGAIAIFWTLAISGIRALTLLVSAMAVFNPAMRPVLAGLQTLLGAAETTFAGMQAKWAETDAKIAKRKIEAKITATIEDLDTKIAAAKAELKTVHGKKARAKIEATIAQLKAQAATAKRELLTVKGAKTEAKIKARITELVAKTKAAEAHLKTVHNKKTEAKIKANIAQLKTQTAAARAELASVKSKSVSITATYTKIIRTINKAAVNSGNNSLPSAGDTWLGAAGGMYRTGGASALTVEAPIIDTRVFIDGDVVRSVARSTVVDENRRAAHRARVGRR